MRCLILCIILIIIITESEGRPSFADAVPLLSQAKTAFLYIIGKPEQAEQTWNNFKNMTHLWENVKDIDNSIPGYGHVKALIVKLNGDDERAGEILYASSKTSCIIGGFVLAGPVGAVEGSIVADAAFSLVLDKPQGVVEHFVNFEGKTASDHVDAVLDLTLAAMGPKVGSKTGSFVKNKIIQRIEMKRVGERVEHKVSARKGTASELVTPSSDVQPKKGILKSTKDNENQKLFSPPEKLKMQSVLRPESEKIKPRIVGRKGVIFIEERNKVYEVERVVTEYEVKQREKMIKLAEKLEKFKET